MSIARGFIHSTSFKNSLVFLCTCVCLFVALIRDSKVAMNVFNLAIHI